MNEPLANALRYNAWATSTLFKACRSLSEAQLDAPSIPGSSGSIRAMLIHVAMAQRTAIWRTNAVMRPRLDSSWPGWERLLVEAKDSAEELIVIARNLERDEVIFEEGGIRYPWELSFFLTAAVTHGDQHRSEIKMAMAGLGVDSPDLDAWNWARDAGFGKPISD
jgi:uncharacterized damage-inducible protein DinB